MSVVLFVAGVVFAIGCFAIYRACRWLDEHGGGAL